MKINDQGPVNEWNFPSFPISRYGTELDITDYVDGDSFCFPAVEPTDASTDETQENVLQEQLVSDRS